MSRQPDLCVRAIAKATLLLQEGLPSYGDIGPRRDFSAADCNPPH